MVVTMPEHMQYILWVYALAVGTVGICMYYVYSSMAPVLHCIYTAHAIIILNQASDCVSNFHNQVHEELCC